MRSQGLTALLAAACSCNAVNTVFAFATSSSPDVNQCQGDVCTETGALHSSWLQVSSDIGARWDPRVEANHEEKRQQSMEGHGDLTFKHIAKTAGTFVKAVLEPGILTNGTVQILSEIMWFQPEDLSSSWTMSVIRNPCEWYLSRWAYISDQTLDIGHPRFESDRPEVHTASPMKDSPEDIQKFREFIRDFHGNSSLGLQSIDFAAGYLQGERVDYILTDSRSPHPTPRLIELKMEPQDYKPEDITFLKHELEKFDVHDIKCWIRTESVEVDLRTCLTQFYLDTRIAVNWTLVDERIAESSHNPSTHGPCKIYYDTETTAYVKQIESYIFDRFDYQTCCHEP